MSRFKYVYICAIALLLCGRGFSYSSEADAERLWVFFTDKGLHLQDNVDAAINQYQNQLPIRTRLRRQRSQGCSVDISDLPVFQPYIDEILQLGATHHISSRWLNGITVAASDGITEKILRLPFVKSIEQVAKYRRSDPKTESQKQSRPYLAPGDLQSVYGMSSTQIHQAHIDDLHSRGYHGEGTVIAVLDTGFDLSHDAFRDINVIAQYDFINGDDETSDQPPEDDIGQDDHGTEVLSVIAGNSQGNLVGVAHAAGYLLAKTERISYGGSIFEKEIEEDWWVAGIEWAEANGADVVSSSLGYSDWYSYRDIDGATAKTTIAANMAVEKGVVVVISAGNEGKSSDWPYISAPADGFDVIAVGAVDAMGEIAGFSSVGPTYDGRIKPDLVAMGDGTYVVTPSSTDAFHKVDGTSLATPLVAGTAALLLQALPDLDDPKLLVKLLKYSATRALSPDNQYGWGVINAEAAFRIGRYPHLMEEVINWEPEKVIPEIENVIVYPNPIKRSTGKLNIRSPESVTSVEIYNLSGTLIYERYDTDYAKSAIWNLNNQHDQKVACGIYICVIKDSTGTVTAKKVAIIE